MDGAALRTRRLAFGIATSFLGRAASLLAPLVIAPATFHYLGDQRYGLWMAATSLTGMALFADLGLGNGLLTRLSQLYPASNSPAAASEVATAYAVLSVLAGGLLVALSVVDRLAPWAALFNVTDPAVAREAGTVALICFGSFALNIPLSLIQRIQYSQQQVGQSNLWQAGGSLLSVAFVLVAVAGNAGEFVVIAGVVLSIPLTNLVTSLYYFGVESPALRPRLNNVDRVVARDLLRLGSRFFALSVLTSVALNADAFLVAHILGLDAAAHYSVVSRLYLALGLCVTLVNLPLWPANAEALARGDVAWVRRSTRRMAYISGTIVAVPGLVMAAYGGQVIAVWLSSDVSAFASAPLLAALGAWCVIVAITSPMFMVQNSVGLLKPQLVGWSAFLVVSVALKAGLAREFGLAGVPIAGCLSYAVTVVPAAVVGYRRSLATTRMTTSHTRMEQSVAAS